MSGRLWTEEQFNCPVCLDLPNDPVTIPCGHSYCMSCIKDFWVKDDATGIYSCPQCRQTFSPRPPLSRNTMLAEAVEQLRKGALVSTVRESLRKARRASMSSSRTSAVPCDVCDGDPRAAVKTCLVCMASYCEAHLKAHQTAPALKKHELIAPTGQLTQKICAQHKYLQEFYCRQCKVFICWLCTSNQHKDHETSSTQAERLERQKVMGEVQSENQQRLKEREAELKDMKKMLDNIQRSTDRANADTETLLTELQDSLERMQELVAGVMHSAGQEKVSQAQDVVDKLEAEISELKDRDVEMRELVRCEDNIHFLQTCDTLCSPLEAGDLPAVTANQDASFDQVREVILDLRDKVEDLCNQELSKITKMVNDTTLFTLRDKGNKTNGPKFGGFLKLFAGRGNRGSPAPTRSQAPTQSVSVGARGADRRAGGGLRSQDVRSRDEPRADRSIASSPRLRQAKNREDRASVTSPVREASPRPSPLSSRRGRKSRSQPEPAPVLPVTVPAAAAFPGQLGGIAPLVKPGGVQYISPRPTEIANTGYSTWGVGAVNSAHAINQVNTGLFLDSPPPDVIVTPAFPMLRELDIGNIQAPEPRSREEFLQYACVLTFDPSTAHRRLCLTEGNTKATLQGAGQPCPDYPQRFDGWTQVLCLEPLSAPRCYWEVEWRGRGSSVGVAYGSMPRKGSDARAGLGYNVRSWSLELSDSCCSAMHDNQKRDIAVTYSPRLGVFLDRQAGRLAFYGVAEDVAHLHTFTANFTQPLYAAFGVGCGVGVGLDFALGQFSSLSDSVKICPM